MTAQSIRMMKEARLVAWPFMAITLAALFAFTSRISDMTSVPIEVRGFIELCVFVGIPLLATVIFGAEFQYNTISLALALPLNRSDFWQSKFTALVFTVLPAAVLLVASQRLSPAFERTYWLAA